MRTLALLAALLGAGETAPRAAERPALSPRRAQALLQAFADAAYLKGFRHLGDRRDFDHGHLLFDEGGRPRAVLYHTQELARYGRGRFGYLDAASRNWLQWLDSGRVERADAYRRRAYPDTPEWRAFVRAELPAYRAHRTITDRMLDPARLGFEVSASRQWEFSRRPCEGAEIRVTPRGAGAPVCLALAD